MAKEEYCDFNFRTETLQLIFLIEGICDDYQAQGYVLTLRQLYYQLVARDIIPNTERSYKRVAGIVNDARLAGLIDWDAIEDRTRSFIRRTRWDNPGQIIMGAAHGFHMDMWANQEARVFCIVEKEALAGVLERVCNTYDIPLLAARGYPSVSVVREFVEEDLIPNSDQDIVILHLGDHDPSGIDMSRDLEDRIHLFARGEVSIQFKRIALNMEQIRQENPPPNPAKSTDSRFKSYQDLYGSESWELDALTPSYLNSLVSKHVAEHIDAAEWEERKEEISDAKNRLFKVAEDFAK